MTFKLFKATTSLPNRPKAFVDWFHADDEKEAKAIWSRGCSASGLPKDSTVELVEVDPVTLKPVQAAPSASELLEALLGCAAALAEAGKAFAAGNPHAHRPNLYESHAAVARAAIAKATGGAL